MKKAIIITVLMFASFSHVTNGGDKRQRTEKQVEGILVPVTDSNTSTWGATIAGGGANHGMHK